MNANKRAWVFVTVGNKSFQYKNGKFTMPKREQG